MAGSATASLAGAEAQQELAATAVSVPQQPPAASALVCPVGVLPQQLPAAGGVNASAGSPAKPPPGVLLVVVLVAMIVLCFERSVREPCLAPFVPGRVVTTGDTKLIFI
jgi:hypothetical protein